MPATSSPLEMSVEFTSNDGKAARFIECFEACAAPTRLEAGCVGYELFRSTGNDNRFVLAERWASPSALLEHLATTHVARLFESIDADLLLVAPPSVVLGGRRIEADDLPANLEAMGAAEATSPGDKA